MAHLKRVIHEVHRRSLWQVLGIYLAGSWVALQVVGAVTQSAGLPDWTPGMALVILVVLLPVVMATAFVQEGLPGGGGDDVPATPAVSPGTPEAAPEPPGPERLHHRVFAWRTVAFGAVGAFTLLGLSIFAYFVMWSSGIGPVGNLQAQGVITEGAPVILAELENRTDDAELGAVLTVALAADLAQSDAIRMFAGENLKAALTRMGVDPGAPVTAAVASDLAVREGLPAWIEGEVGAVGASFVLTARVVAADGGESLATFRETAADEGDLLNALERLSRGLRERLGESLRSINRTPALQKVTTSSLEALRRYTEAWALGDVPQAYRLLDEAIALDTAFAMAYRRLSILHDNNGRAADARATAEAAFRHSERLSRVERDLTLAAYQDNVLNDFHAALNTYRSILEYAPEEATARHNLAYKLRLLGRDAEVIDLVRPGFDQGSDAAAAQLLLAYLGLGDAVGARQVLDRRTERGPDFPPQSRARLAMLLGDTDEAHAWADSAAESRGPVETLYWKALADARIGKMSEAAEHMARSADIQARTGNHVAASWSRVLGAWAVLQSDTARALDILTVVERDAARAGADSVHFGNLAWGFWQAGSWEGVARVNASSQGRSGAGLTGLTAEYLALLAALSRGEYDPAMYEEYLADCWACARQERAEAAYRAGKIQEAADLYEEILTHPGWRDWYHVVAPLDHERAAAIYEELGDRAKAAEHYRAFAELWKDADPELQPLVRQAREKAMALGGGTGG